MNAIVHVVIILIVVGLLLWAVKSLPIDGTIQNIIRVVVIVAAVLYVLQVFGLFSGLRI